MVCKKCGNKMRCVNTREKDNVRYRAYRCHAKECFSEEWTIEQLCKDFDEVEKVIWMLWNIHDEQKRRVKEDDGI